MSQLLIPNRPIPILGQTTTISIAPTTRYGHKSDAATAHTELILSNPGSEDMSVAMSLLTSDPDDNAPPQPRVRIRKETRDMAHVDLDEVAKTALLDAVSAQATTTGQDSATARASVEKMLALAKRHHKTYVTVKAGQKLYLEFTHRERVYPTADGSFRFSTVAPLPLYCLQPGSSIWVGVALPRPIDGAGVRVVDRTQGFGLLEQTFNNRQLLSWFWQNDPELFVHYSYA